MVEDGCLDLLGNPWLTFANSATGWWALSEDKQIRLSVALTLGNLVKDGTP